MTGPVGEPDRPGERSAPTGEKAGSLLPRGVALLSLALTIPTVALGATLLIETASGRAARATEPPPVASRARREAPAPEARARSQEPVESSDGLVGSEACAGCHPDAWNEWAASSHHRTIDDAVPGTVLGRFAPVDAPQPVRITGPTWPRAAAVGDQVTVRMVESEGRFYAVFEGADAFIDMNFETTPDGRYTFPLDYTLGKLFYQTYLARMPNGEIYVTPLMWDIGKEEWRLAGWRPFGTDCAHCHVTGLELADRPAGSAGVSPWSEPTRWVDLPVDWLEMSVGCEVCHGPGAAHVEEPTAATIVDPSRLDNRSQADLCGSCHGMGVANAQTYTPGATVDPPMDNAAVPPGWRINAFWPTGQHKTYFTMYQGHLSGPHWQEAGLSCAPCHPAHAGGTRYPIADNSQCTLCHTGLKRRLTEHTRHSEDGPGSTCVECHMPRNNRFTLVPGVVLMTHVHSHDLTIPDPRRTLDHGVPNACGQCHAEEGPVWALERIRSMWPDALTAPSRPPR